MIKRFFLAFFSLMIFFLQADVIDADQMNENLKMLQKLNEELNQYVKAENYEKAKLTVEEISQLVPSVQFEKLTTVEGIEAITSTLIQAKRSLAGLQPDIRAVKFYTTQLYLAIDALIHRSQPLWQRYYPMLNQDIENMKDSIKLEEEERFNKALQSFQVHYKTIRPSLIVSKQPFEIERIDSLITALIGQTVNQNKEIVVIQLKENIYRLFYGDGKETWGNFIKEKALWQTSLGMGMIIFIVLSYVIWRKFKGAYFSSAS